MFFFLLSFVSGDNLFIVSAHDLIELSQLIDTDILVIVVLNRSLLFVEHACFVYFGVLQLLVSFE